MGKLCAKKFADTPLISYIRDNIDARKLRSKHNLLQAADTKSATFSFIFKLFSEFEKSVFENSLLFTLYFYNKFPI